MKKQIIIIILLLIGWMSGSGQKYIRQIDNFGMLNSSQFTSILESKASKIDSLIPMSATDRIVVFDFRHYLHNTAMSGEKSVGLLLNQSLKVAEKNKYFILFNFTLFPNNSLKVDFKMNLPTDGNFACVNSEKLNSIEENVLFTLSNCTMENVDEKVSKSLDIILSIITNTNLCCNSNGNRSLTTLDPDKLKLEVYLADESSCNSGFCVNKENDVTYFRESAPKVYTRIYYTDPLYACVDLRIS